MKKSNFLLCTMLLIVFGVSGQSEWEVFTTPKNAKEIEFHNNKTFITTTGGLFVINKETDEEELWTSANSPLKGHGTDEIEMLTDGRMWITPIQDGGINYIDIDGEDNEYYYTLDNGDTLHHVTKLTANDDELWFQNNNTVYRLKDKNIVDQSNIFPFLVHSQRFDSNDKLWSITTSHLELLKNNSDKEIFEIPPYEGRSYNSVLDYYIDSKDIHWLALSYATDEKILWKFDNGTWTLQPDILEAIDIYTFKIQEKPDGQIFISRVNAIGILQDNTIIIDSLAHLHPDLEQYEYLKLHSIEDDGTIWLTNFVNTIKISNEGVKLYGENDRYNINLPSLGKGCDDKIYAAFRDVAIYENNQWSSSPYEPKTQSCAIANLTLNEYTCEMWGYTSAADCHSLLRISDQDVDEIDILPDGGCTALAFSDKDTYYASWSEFYRIDSVGIAHSLLNNNITGWISELHYAKDSSLWILSNFASSSYVYRLKHEALTHYPNEEFANSLISAYNLYEDKEENIWLHSDQEIHKYNGTEWSTLSLDFLKPFDVISDLAIDSKGNYWISTWRDGLYFWDGEELTAHFNIINSDISSNRISKIEITQDDIIWLEHNYGLTKMTIDFDKLNSTKSTQSETNTPSFSLYPNPTQGSFTLSFPHLEKRKIEIFSTDGRQVYSKQTESSSLEVLSLEVLEAGCYWVRVSGASGMAVEKVVVY